MSLTLIKIPILMSYAYLRMLPQRILSYVFNNPRAEFLIDCGAFSALNAGKEIDLEAYMDFIDEWKDKFFGYMALDKLGDPVQTNKNLDIMIKRSLNPIPVHVRGDEQERMDELFDLSSWVAFGGLRLPHRGHCSPEYLKLKMDWARSRQVHWLGYTSLPAIVSFKPFSCDCSNALSSLLRGEMYMYRGRGRMEIIGCKDFFQRLKLPKYQALIYKTLNDMGIDYSHIHREEMWHGNNSLSSRVTFFNFIQYVDDVYLATGTRIYTAFTQVSCFSFYKAIDAIYEMDYTNSHPSPPKSERILYESVY
jgi:hypothetical protein